MRVRPLLLGVLVVLTLTLSLPSFATPTSEVFTVSGLDSANNQVSATITFTSTGSNNLSIELKNTTGSILDAAEILDQVSFNMPGATLISSTVTFGSQAGAGLVYLNTKGTGASTSTYGWTLDLSNPDLLTYSNPSDGVINQNTGSANASLYTKPHNPLLIDPIFTFTGSGFELSELGNSITTNWGTGTFSLTGAACTPGTTGCNTLPPERTPEPSSLALLGGGLLGVASLGWRRFFKR